MESAAGPSDRSTPVSSRPSRQRQIPSDFVTTVMTVVTILGHCVLCVFWIDCNDCGWWVYNVCAFGGKHCYQAVPLQQLFIKVIFHFHFLYLSFFSLEKSHFLLTSLNSNCAGIFSSFLSFYKRTFHIDVLKQCVRVLGQLTNSCHSGDNWVVCSYCRHYKRSYINSCSRLVLMLILSIVLELVHEGHPLPFVIEL